MLHSSPAASSMACPPSIAWSDQSTAQGPISTTAPASPSPAATQRARETFSPRTNTDSGISQNSRTLDSKAVRPDGT